MTARIGDSSVRRRGQLFVALAAVAWSTAGVLQRELSVGTTTQLAGRALFACVGLAAYVAVANRGRTLAAFRSMGRAGLGVAVCTALASGSFIVALNHATVANVLFMQAAAPVAAALLVLFTLIKVLTNNYVATWAWIGLVLSAGIVTGAWLSMKAAGESLSDLKTSVAAAASNATAATDLTDPQT